MRSLFVHVLVLCWMASGAVKAQEKPPEFKHPDVIHNAIHEFYVPTYRQFVTTTRVLTREIATLCRTPSEEQLTVARSAFRDTILAWSRAEIVRFGPVLNLARMEHISFWPDVKGIGERQYRRLMQKKDPRALNIETLKKKSVALQDLTALERVLYDTQSSTLALATNKRGFTCGYGAAIAASVSDQGQRVLDEWATPPSYAEYLVTPGFHNPHFLDSNAVAALFLSSFSVALEFVHDRKLALPLGTSAQKAKPKRAQWRLSNLGMQSIVVNLQAVQDLYLKSKLGAALPEDKKWIDANIKSNLERSLEVAQEIGVSISEAAISRDDREQLIYLAKLIRNLQDLMSHQTIAALNVVTGFEWVDGD